MLYVMRDFTKQSCRSIKDGRFLKQKAAMARCGCRAVLYLIEGEPDRARLACLCSMAIAAIDVSRTCARGP